MKRTPLTNNLDRNSSNKAPKSHFIFILGLENLSITFIPIHYYYLHFRFQSVKVGA